MRDPVLEQLQRQRQEAETRATEAERRERDAELKRLETEAAQARARADQAERRASDEERKQFVLQAKSELENQAYSRLEILIGVFGALITAVVVFFAWNTKETAVAAAKAGVEDIRGKLEARLEEAELLLKNIRTVESQASEFMKNLPPGEAQKSEEDRKAVADVAVAALAKPSHDRSASEYRAIISKHEADKNWDEMLNAAREMQLLFSEKPEDLALALIAEGVALWQSGRPENAISVWDGVVARFGAKTESALRERVARSLFNKAAALADMKQYRDEIATYDELISRFEDTMEPVFQELVAEALVNKGVAIARLGLYVDSIVLYDNVILRLESRLEVALQKQVAMALVNKAVSLGQLGQWDAAIAACDALIVRFEDSKEPELREMVGRARLLKMQIQGFQKM